MKKLLALVMTLAMLLSMTAFASAQSSLSVSLASEPDTLDPALNSAVDGATMIVHLFSGLAAWTQDAEGKFVIAPDAAVELPEGVANEDGTVKIGRAHV